MRKNINPKSLKGQDKLNRMLGLMDRMNTLTESKSFSELELIKKGPNGIVYGIIRENRDYFIKTTNKTSGQFLSEDFSYVGGLQNKYDERYKSYAEAIKHLNMKFDMLNESYGIDSNTNIFESDGVAFGGGVGFGFVMEEDDEEDKNESKQEIISDADLEEQKKVLKVDAPKAETPVEDEVEDEVDVDMGGDIADVEFDEEETEEGGDEFGDEGMEDEEGDEDGDTKKIQKYTGKIGQMLRDMDESDLDLEKYVINSIISAMHLDEMDEEDKEDIIEKIESGDEEEDDFDMEGGEEEADLDLDDEETTEELPEEGGEDEDKEDDEDKEVVKVKKEQLKMLEEEGICTCGDKCLLYPEAKGVDASDLLKQGAKSGKECIILTDDNMTDLKSEGECKCGGVKLKCKKEKNEGRVFSKKQLMESFLRNTTKKSLKRVLRERRELCEECGGRLTEGMCMECGPNEHHMGKSSPGQYDREAYIMDEEDIMNEKLVGKQHKLDRNKNGKIDAEDFRMLRKGRKDRRRNIDEDEFEFIEEPSVRPRGERPPMPPTIEPNLNSDKYLRPRGLDEDMDVMDAIATGQGYLDATNDLDRDFDGIPNRLDMDNNDDGELDFSMGRKDRYRSIGDDNEDFIELDIDFLRNSEAPVKEPGIKEPTTKPGKGDKWRTIKRPKVDPKPKAGKRMDRSDKPRPSYRRRGMFR
jgi:hypothetical protein